MKAIKLTFILILLASCTSNDDILEDCNCKATTYFNEDNVDEYVISVQDLGCVEPEKSVKVSNNVYYKIECD